MAKKRRFQAICTLYAYEIMNDRMGLDEVPKVLRKQVEETLKGMGYFDVEKDEATASEGIADAE